MSESLLCLFRTQWKKPRPFQSCQPLAVSNFLGPVPVWITQRRSLPRDRARLEGRTLRRALFFSFLWAHDFISKSILPHYWVWLRGILSILSGSPEWTLCCHVDAAGGKSSPRTPPAYLFDFSLLSTFLGPYLFLLLSPILFWPYLFLKLPCLIFQYGRRNTPGFDLENFSMTQRTLLVLWLPIAPTWVQGCSSSSHLIPSRECIGQFYS